MQALDKVKNWLQNRFQKPQPKDSLTPPPALVERYQQYKRLLAANSNILAIQADLQQKMHEGFLFDMAYVKGALERLGNEVQVLVAALIAMSQGRYAALEEARQEIARHISRALKGPELTAAPLILPLEEVTEGRFFGGKAEKLAEVARLGLAVPRGFAISACAQKLFFEATGLEEFIKKTIVGACLSDLESLKQSGDMIREQIIEEPLPQELAELLNQHMRNLGAARVAVRSSALHEDSVFSFAGQFETFLNVPSHQVEQRYKEVIASQFTARALYYCYTKGFSLEEMAMGVIIMEMVDAQAAGVLYTADPRHGERAVIINAVRGLGSLAVGGGVEPDIYRVKEGKLVHRQAGDKTHMQVPAPEGGVLNIVTPTELRDFCLDEAAALRLAALGETLERHFGLPQDVEWTLSSQGCFYILQSRPLRLAQLNIADYLPPRLKDAEVLLSQGIVASRGAAAGPVFHLTEERLQDVPEGVVAVAKRALPEFGVVVDKAVAMVCEAGSPTSHLATVLREAGIPAVFGAKGATQVLTPDTLVTVDAYYGNVYAGRQEELLKTHPGENLLKQSRAYQVLQAVLKHVTPLHLLDPRADNFRPENCTTYHDITRFAHEKAMTELFQVSDGISVEEGARLLKTTIPLQIYLLDVGGGLRPEVGENFEVTPDQLASRPMRAYWRGVQAVGWIGPKPVDLKGFMSIVMGTGAGENIRERLTEKNYAIIAADYMNLSTRLGFHFATIDSYLGTLDDSYVSLTFYGGGAEILRRIRRVRFLAKVLAHLDFQVELKDDSLVARLDRLEVPLLEEKLDILGRLMMVSKQMDMVMFNDAMVDYYYKEFIKEGYTLKL